MICRVGTATSRGRVVTVEAGVATAVLARAVREGTASDGTVDVAIRCRRPHPVHERVGCIEPGLTLRARTALAAAGRARGLRTPVDPELRTARQELAAMTVEVPRTDDARERLAGTDADAQRLRERVATARGRVQARRDLGADPAEAAGDLAAAVADLSEVETRAVAARQEHEDARRRAREARDRLEARLRQADAVANLQRTARAYLVDRLRGPYAAALAAVPGAEAPAEPFDAPPAAMALAIARVARFDAPVVVSGDRFASASAAGRWLDAPVVAPTA